ncbi:MAG: heterocyst development glycosyltransferase HepC [Cyanobacteria bacterium J06621_8]
MTSNIVIQTSRLLTLDLDSPKVKSYLPACNLKWRQKNLWVNSVAEENGYNFPALTRKQWLVSCLRNSSIERVCLDHNLGERSLKLWADTCQQSQKPVYLRINSYGDLPNCRQTFYWGVKRILDWLSAGLLLMLLSPVMLAIALGIKVLTPGPIFYWQWRVGERGTLFRICKFRTMKLNAEEQHHQVMGSQAGLHKLKQDPRITFLGKFLRQFSLDELPQLFNVLRGEMSLVGPRPWALYDALRLDQADFKRLNALPGITGAWQVQSRSQLLDLRAVTKCDLEYLSGWSLLGDLKILLLTIPKVVTGRNAY